MSKIKPRKPKPSRARYEAEHPVFSARPDRATYDRLANHFNGTSCSLADFVNDSLGREESMVEKRIEMLAARKSDPSLEERVRILEGLVIQIMTHAELTQIPYGCPRIDGRLHHAMMAEMGSQDPDTFKYACPKCGHFVDQRGRLDPKSLRWIDSDGRFISKPSSK